MITRADQEIIMIETVGIITENIMTIKNTMTIMVIVVNQTIVLAIYADFLWHNSCDLLS
jgi:hypothetical protein